MTAGSAQRDGAEWFTTPGPVNQRRYEALRAFFVDGLSHAEAAARSSGATPDQRINARWAAAIASQHLGDRVRARSDLQNLLRELEGQPNYVKFVADIQQRLKDL